MNARPGLIQIIVREVSRAEDFAALTEVCEGAWPGEVRQVLKENPIGEAQRLLMGIDRPAGRISTDRRLPLAHPLDADWRFTRESAERVLDTILAASPSTAPILLIAMPTVALAAHDRGLSHRIVVASRLGDPIDAALRTAMTGCQFLPLREIPASSFQAVALDPPWYDDVALPLIKIAQDAVAADGHVYVCAPDVLTSPSDAQRLCALPDRPQELGFSAVTAVERVRYATPFFELQCLRSIGIANISPTWRTGLLYTCRPGSGATRPPSWSRPAAADWHEVQCGPIRVWVRQRASRGEACSVAVAGSISRADATREIAAMWTSGNTYAADVGLIDAEIFQEADDDMARSPCERRLRAALADERITLEHTVDFM